MEPITATNALAMTLAGLLSLSQSFSDGVKAYEKKDYEAAAKSFSLVLSTGATTNPLHATALYFRSRSYADLEKSAEAKADLEALLSSSPTPSLAGLAQADYKRLTGKDWDYVDLSTPEKAWASMTAAIRNQDAKAVLRCCTGRMAEELAREVERAVARPSFWEEGMREVVNVTITGVAYSEDKAAAVLTLLSQRGHGEQKVVMECSKGQWRFSAPYEGSIEDFDANFPKKGPPKTTEASAPATAAEEKQILALIRQLGASSAKERADAFDKLKAFGAKAAKPLEDAATDPDPEISFQSQKLLSLIEDRAAPAAPDEGGPVKFGTRLENIRMINGPRIRR